MAAFFFIGSNCILNAYIICKSFLNPQFLIMRIIFCKRIPGIFKLCLLVLFSTLILFSSCKKGDTGPAGPIGSPGAQGPVGPAGADGSVILSGTAAPVANLGKVGDFYLNKSNSDFYGPKTAAGWGQPFSLKGADGTNGTNGTNGANGANGKTILSGEVAPADSLGSLGDFYLNIITHNFYGPKTLLGWGTPFNLRGDIHATSGTFNLSGLEYFNSLWNIDVGGSGGKNSVPAREAIVGVPAITRDIYNNGTILIYMSIPDGNTDNPGESSWTPLPFSTGVFNGGYLISIRNTYVVGQIHIFYMHDATDKATTPPDVYQMEMTPHQFKYVLIPADPAARRGEAPVDYMDYNAVRKYYHLTD